VSVPRLSFCIVTNGRRRPELCRVIAAIHDQASVGYEILVCGQVGFELDRARFLPMAEAASHGRLGAMRNALASAACHENLVIIDDDIEVQPGFSQAALRCLGNADILAIRLRNPDGSRHWDWAIRSADRHALLPYGVLHPDVYVTGGACVIKREVAMRVGWDDHRGFYQGEDVDFSARARACGYSIGFCHEAIAVHLDERYTQDGEIVVLFADLPRYGLLQLFERVVRSGELVRALRVLRVWARHNPTSKKERVLLWWEALRRGWDSRHG